MNMRFQGRTAIITGAASGMGLVASQEMAKEGAVIYMVDINEERLRQAGRTFAAMAARRCPAFATSVIMSRSRPL